MPSAQGVGVVDADAVDAVGLDAISTVIVPARWIRTVTRAARTATARHVMWMATARRLRTEATAPATTVRKIVTATIRAPAIRERVTAARATRGLMTTSLATRVLATRVRTTMIRTSTAPAASARVSSSRAARNRMIGGVLRNRGRHRRRASLRCPRVHPHLAVQGTISGRCRWRISSPPRPPKAQRPRRRGPTWCGLRALRKRRRRRRSAVAKTETKTETLER